MARTVEQIAKAPREALARLRLALSTRFGARLRELILFGSHARGEATDSSDVDVLVVIDELTPMEKLEALGTAYEAAIDEDGEWTPMIPLMMATADAEHLRNRERLLMREIARDGVLL